MVVVSFLPEWLINAAKNLPLLSEAIQRLLVSDSTFEVIPACKIDEQVMNWLYQARTIEGIDPMALEYYLSSHIILGLAYYEKLLNDTDSGKIYRIKNYIMEKHIDPEIDIANIIAQTKLPYWTAMRKFKKIYGLSMRSFLLEIRMRHATEYLSSGEMEINDVFKIVGYTNANSFRKAYRNYIMRK